MELIHGHHYEWVLAVNWDNRFYTEMEANHIHGSAFISTANSRHCRKTTQALYVHKSFVQGQMPKTCI